MDKLGTPVGSVATGLDLRDPNELPKDDERSLFGEAVKANFIISDSEDVDRLFKDYEDTGWRADKETLRSLEGLYDEDQFEAFIDAVSEEEFNDLRSEFDVSNERRRWLNEQGWEGTAAEIGATLLDPLLWGATISAELGGIALVGAKASRVARLTRSLGAAGVSETAMMSIRAETQNDYSDRDMAFDMLAALTITGGLELALGRNSAELVKGYDEVGVNSALDAGAKQREIKPESWRFDDYAQRINSGNAEAQTFAQTHLQDPVAGGSHSSAIKAERIRSQALAKSNEAFIGLWKSHKEANGLSGLNVVDKARHMNDLSEKVWEAKVMGVDHGPEIQKVASTLDGIYNDFLGQAEDAGLEGFSRDLMNPAYMKQEWDTTAWSALRKEVAEEEFVELINKGLYGFDEFDILKRIDELDVAVKQAGEEGAEALVKELEELVAIREARSMLAVGFTKRMLDRSDGAFRSLDELMDDEESLVAWLKESGTYSGKSDEEIRAFVSKATRRKQRQKDVVDRAKKRIQINPKASIMSKAGKEVRVADLMNRNAMELNQGYIHNMSGHIAMAQNGIKSPSEWKATLATIRKQELDRLAGQKNASKLADELVEKVERDRREIMGLARYDTSANNGQRLVNMFLKYNFMTAMGKAAFSALSEMGRIVGENGIRNTLKSITALDGLFTDALRTVGKHDHVVREVNEFNGSIGDEYLLRYFNSFDETGVLEGKMTNGAMSKAEIIAHRGAQLMAKGSLLAPVDKALRLLSFSSSTNALYRQLVQGKPSRLALKQMGLTKPILDDIAKNMRAHTSVSSTGHVQKLGIEKWDRATADAFMDAMTTNGARQVQKGIAGEGTALVEHPVGRVFFQFRKFAIGAYSKHFRADLRDARDEPLRVLLSTTFAATFAALGYYGRTMASTLGMDESDRKKFLKERFEKERIAANAAQYTPNIGSFVTGWNLTGGSMINGWEIPVTRTTGLSHRFDSASNASTDKLNRMFSLLSDLNEKSLEDVVSQAKPLIPGQNTIPGELVTNTAKRLAD